MIFPFYAPTCFYGSLNGSISRELETLRCGL
nr:MAG TPA: hypothetical protein [Caudoviricetes sp.]